MPGLDDEALHPIGSLDDLGLEIGQDAGQGAVKDRPLIGAVGEQFPEKGKQTEQGRQQRETAVAILNVGGGDDAVQQQVLQRPMGKTVSPTTGRRGLARRDHRYAPIPGQWVSLTDVRLPTLSGPYPETVFTSAFSYKRTLGGAKNLLGDIEANAFGSR